jgi:hypothetical protein
MSFVIVNLLVEYIQRERSLPFITRSPLARG